MPELDLLLDRAWHVFALRIQEDGEDFRYNGEKICTWDQCGVLSCGGDTEQRY